MIVAHGVGSPDNIEEVFDFDVCVPQGTLQRIAVNLIVEGKYNDAAIGMFHLQMAALSMNFDETWPRECRQDLSALAMGASHCQLNHF